MRLASSTLARARASVLLVLLASLGALALGCSGSGSTESAATQGNNITIGVYTTPREAYGALLPVFREQQRAAGREVTIQESYLGSGAQARAILGGFEADLAALSLDPDIELLRGGELIRHDWRAGEFGGMVTRSVVVIGVRAGNPKNIRTWQDLARPGIEVLTPNVRTSGGAMWNVLAIYGAAMRGHAGVPAGDRDAAIGLLASILRNVKIMDRSGRDSMLTFERGVGDAIITYENEMLVGRAGGRDYEYITGGSTILIENPIALIDANVDRHGTRELTQAFIDFLRTPESQRTFAEHGLRPVLPAVEAETRSRFATVEDLFTIRDLGGWAEAQRLLFDENGIYDQALARGRQEAP